MTARSVQGQTFLSPFTCAICSRDVGIDGASGLYPTLSPTPRRDTLEETGRDQSPRYRLRDPRSTRDPYSRESPCTEPNARTRNNHGHDDLNFSTQWRYLGNHFHIHFFEHNDKYDIYVVHRHKYAHCAECHDLPSNCDCSRDLLDCSVNSHLDAEIRDNVCPVHIHNLDDGKRDHNWSNDSDYGEPNHNFDILHDDE
jgi:hypothetical protein